jgi:hypothetical protein
MDSKNLLCNLNGDVLEVIFEKLPNDTKLNFLVATNDGFNQSDDTEPIDFSMTPKMARNFTMNVQLSNVDDCKLVASTWGILNLKILGDSKSDRALFDVIENFAGCVENIQFLNVKFDKYSCGVLTTLKKIKILSFVKCTSSYSEKLEPIQTLTELTLNDSSEDIFKVLSGQRSLKKICVEKLPLTWNGFPHEVLTVILKNSPNVHLMLIGPGTGSYMDHEDAESVKLQKLNTTMITFHWYVGIRTQRTSFLASQLDSLTELTIHQLPFDFDGGRVLKYICESMKLNKFQYRQTMLIDNFQKQIVTDEIEFCEIQIMSAFEIVKQFPG